MICNVMLCYAVLCYIMLYYVMICYDMLCYVTLCYVMSFYVMLLLYHMHVKIKIMQKIIFEVYEKCFLIQYFYDIIVL